MYVEEDYDIGIVLRVFLHNYFTQFYLSNHFNLVIYLLNVCTFEYRINWYLKQYTGIWELWTTRMQMTMSLTVMKIPKIYPQIPIKRA